MELKELIDHCGAGREKDYTIPETVDQETTKKSSNSNQPTTATKNAEVDSGIATYTPASAATSTTQVKTDSSVLDADSIKKMLPSDEKNAIVTVENGNVAITREMSDNLNNDWMLRGSRLDTIDIFKSLFKDPRVKKVTVTSTISLVDTYGQTSTGVGTIYTMSRATYQKINWDKFLTENLDKVADNVYTHPIFSR